MGAGKSYWGARISQLSGLNFIDLDQAIESYCGKTIRRIFEESGEEGFRQKESEVLRNLVENQKSFVMACGGGTPCYLNNIEYMKMNGTVVWLHPPAKTLLERLNNEKEERPLISNLNSEQLEEFVLHKLAERRVYYEQAHIEISSDSLDTADLLKQIIHRE